jgi:hypothetical protein
VEKRKKSLVTARSWTTVPRPSSPYPVTVPAPCTLFLDSQNMTSKLVLRTCMQEVPSLNLGQGTAYSCQEFLLCSSLLQAHGRIVLQIWPQLLFASTSFPVHITFCHFTLCSLRYRQSPRL